MIKVFSSTDKDFRSNGDAVILPLEAEVHCEDNGEFYLWIVAQTKDSKYLQSGNILVAPTPQGEQAFRVSGFVKSGINIEAKCYHVYYDTLNYLIADSNIVEKNTNEALNHLNKALEPKSIFTVSSNVKHIDSYRCVRESFFNAIEIIRETWGGHLVRDNFNIQLKEEIGADHGVTVRYRRNLEEIEVEENWDDVVTKILPTGTDGILLDVVGRDKNGEGWIHNDNKDIYLTSETQYPIPFTKTVSFNQEINQDDYATEKQYIAALVADLKAQAQAYMELHCVPEVSYTLKAHLDKVSNIGDTIQVIDERLGVNLLTRVIAYDFNCLTGRYSQIEFGNFKKSLSNLMSSISAQIDTKVFDAFSESTQMFQSELEARTINGATVTAFLTENATGLTANNYTKLTLTGYQGIGASMTFFDGGIAIGEGISHVLVSGLLSFNASGSGNRHFRIVKNSYSDENTVARCGAYATTSMTLPISIPSVLVPVQEGDVIYLYYYANSSSDSIFGDAQGCRTNITVQKANMEYAGYSEVPDGDSLAYGLIDGNDLAYGS